MILMGTRRASAASTVPATARRALDEVPGTAREEAPPKRITSLAEHYQP